jgi:hypothetical protein
VTPGKRFSLADLKKAVKQINAANIRSTDAGFYTVSSPPREATGEELLGWLRAEEFELDYLKRDQLVLVARELEYASDELRGKGITQIRALIKERI